jgi:hypothetical protein
MKWLFIIAILIILAGGMLWLRTVRQGPETATSDDPHRLDDSVAPPATPGLRPDIPPPTTAAGVAAERGAEVPDEPGADLYSEPESIGPDEPGPRDDLPPSETRPQG